MDKLEQKFVNLVDSSRTLAEAANELCRQGLTIQAEDMLHHANCLSRRVLIIASACPRLAAQYKVEHWALYPNKQGDPIGKAGVVKGP